MHNPHPNVLLCNPAWHSIFFEIWAEVRPEIVNIIKRKSNNALSILNNCPLERTATTMASKYQILLLFFQLFRCMFWKGTKQESGGSSRSTSFQCTNKVSTAFAVETSCCGFVPRMWPANVPKSSQGRSTCFWAQMTIPPARAVWWQTREACSSLGRTCGAAGWGNSNSAIKGGSAKC